MARDDFSARTVDLLMKQVGGACSRPTCDVQTVGPVPRLAPEKISNVGVAAHIAAASPGGPRFDPRMTAAERSSADNGIWLCAVCAREIDNDADSYPTELLRSWKATALQTALDRHRKPILSDAAVEERVEAIFKASPSVQALRAIFNAHRATDSYLSGLDPRLAVSTSFVAGTLQHEIRAREQVDVKLTVTGTDAETAREELRKLFEEGQTASIPATSMKLLGSELLEQLTGDLSAGVLQVAPISHLVTLRLSLVHGPSRTSAELATVEGTGTAGSKALNLSWELWGGLLKMSSRAAIEADDLSDSTLSLIPCFEAWDGRDIRFLPHFEDIRSFAAKAVDGATLHIEAYAQGRLLFQSASDLPPDGLARTLNAALHYTRLASEFARRFHWPIQFRPKFLYRVEDHQRLAEAFDVMTGGRNNLDLGNQPVVITTVLAEPLQITDEMDLSKLMFFAGPACRVPVFDWFIELPPIVLEITGKAETPRRTYKAGKKITFKFDPRKHVTTLKWTLGQEGEVPVLTPRPPGELPDDPKAQC